MIPAEEILKRHEKDCGACGHEFMSHLWASSKTNAAMVGRCHARIITQTAGTGSGAADRDIMCECSNYKPITLLEALAKVEEILNEQRI